jgi:hypothetical protein
MSKFLSYPVESSFKDFLTLQYSRLKGVENSLTKSLPSWPSLVHHGEFLLKDCQSDHKLKQTKSLITTRRIYLVSWTCLLLYREH